MPTAAKPPPEHDVAQLVLGLFRWLRDKGHTTATVPGRARKGIATALARGTLNGLAKTMATAFLVATMPYWHKQELQTARGRSARPRGRRPAIRGSPSFSAPPTGRSPTTPSEELGRQKTPRCRAVATRMPRPRLGSQS